MISEVLDRSFVLNELGPVLNVLRRRASPRRGDDSGENDVEVGADDYREAAKKVEAALLSEQRTSSGPDGLDAATRRGDGSETLSGRCFISSDPVISITQSALECYFNHKRNEQQTVDNAEHNAFVTRRTLAPAHRRVLDKFSVTDPGWVASLVAMGISKFRSPHAFNPIPAPAHALARRSRLIMVGDWGSGLPRAQKVAASMRKYVEEAINSGVECHVIHLGDVYYSGWEFEYVERFLKFWPVNAGEKDRVASWSLNGNHDMYSGGHGYFGTLLKDSRFARQHGSSFFSLFNADWRIAGLDTAWDDNGLKDPQYSWLAANVRGGEQRTLLLTHHQFFSAYENDPAVGKVLREKLGPLLSSGKIYGGIWGHEHRCVLYHSHAGLEYARLIGHGGVPVYMSHGADDEYPTPAAYEDRRFICGSNPLERWAYMGFSVHDLEGPRMSVAYVDENGFVCRAEVIGPRVA